MDDQQLRDASRAAVRERVQEGSGRDRSRRQSLGARRAHAGRLSVGRVATRDESGVAGEMVKMCVYEAEEVFI